MASDRLVTPNHVLKALMGLQRRGSRRMLSEWERREPDLTEYMLESLTDFYHQLTDAGMTGGQARRLYRMAESIVIVSITALRQAQREGWDGDGDNNNDNTDAADPIPPPPT